jgi:hypothetical protein
MMLFQKVWIENPDLRAKLFNDELNVAHCDHCGLNARVASTMLVSNVPENYAVWYEPKPDPAVDQFSGDMKRAYGEGNFYCGELKGKPLPRSSLEGLQNLLSGLTPAPE